MIDALKAFKEKWNPNEIKTNAQRVKTYAELELLKLEHEEASTEEVAEIDNLTSQLNLQHVVSDKMRWYHKVDQYVRMAGAVLTLIVISMIMVIPCTFFMLTDYLLVDILRILPSCFKFNLIAQRAIGHLLLLMSGFIIIVDDQRENATLKKTNKAAVKNPMGVGFIFQFFRFWYQWYKNSRSYVDSVHNQGNVTAMFCFTHASTLEGFVLPAVTPVQSYTYVKAELFMIPYFGWLSAIFGGIAIERGSPAKAIKSLNSVNAHFRFIKNNKDIKLHDTTVGISPEGTRSSTGQLLSFKKGPFHLWEHLKYPPIIPLLVMGAFELMPPSAAKKKQKKQLADDAKNGTANLAGDLAEVGGEKKKPKKVKSSSFKCGRVIVRLLPAINLEDVHEEMNKSHAVAAAVSHSSSNSSGNGKGGKGNNHSKTDDQKKKSAAASPVTSHEGEADEGHEMRTKVSNLLRRRILTSFRDAYPDDAGGALTWPEFWMHKSALYGAIAFDFWVIKHFVYDIGMNRFGLSAMGIFFYFVVYSVVVTLITYTVKVKVPQYLY